MNQHCNLRYLLDLGCAIHLQYSQMYDSLQYLRPIWLAAAVNTAEEEDFLQIDLIDQNGVCTAAPGQTWKITNTMNSKLFFGGFPPKFVKFPPQT